MTDERWPHFCSDEEMNSSMIVCAPLAKSPNWASQSTSVRPLHGVAVLEAHGRELAEQRVHDPEPALVLAEVEQWRPLGRGALVDEDGVPLHERAAPAVLTGQPDRGALDEQRPERDQLTHRPVDPASLVIAERRSSSCRSFGCTVKPSGMLVNASPICFSTSGVMAVLFFHRGAAA